MSTDLSYAEFFRAHWLYVVRHILYRYPQLGWHDAEDVAQDTLLRVWEQWDEYDASRASRVTWLMTIALWNGRTVFNRYKRAAPESEPRATEDESGEVEPDPYEGAARRDMIDKVCHRISSLSYSVTMCELYARLFAGDTIQEAVQASDMSYAVATWRLRHIRAILRREVDASPLVV